MRQKSLGPSDFNKQVQLLTRTVTLNASNQLSAELNGEPGSNFIIEVIGVDNDAPVITASVNPQPVSNDWNTSSVTVSFECSDVISDIKECSTPIVVNKEGAGQVITGTAIDNAGNTANIDVTINIDTIKPTINYTLTPVANAAGWNNSDVVINFTCNDSGSGIADCTSPITATVDGSNQSFSGEQQLIKLEILQQ